MIPTKHDITIWRNTSFEEEFVSQIKTYNYDPVVNNTKADLIRTHEENIKHYGFEHSYVNFNTTYIRAELIFNRSWFKLSPTSATALLVLTSEDGDVVLGINNIKILMNPTVTSNIEFDSAVYELLLHKASGAIDKLIYGDVTILGNK
jgi:hypothetical protein